MRSWLLIAAFLAGCVTQKPVSLPDGRQGYSVSCPGTARSIADCMNRAAKLCGKYEVVGQDAQQTGGVLVGNGAGGGTWVNGVKRELIVACAH